MNEVKVNGEDLVLDLILVRGVLWVQWVTDRETDLS